MKISERPLIATAAIQERIHELAAQIDKDYKGKHPVLLITLSGAFFFAADLARQLHETVQIEFIRAQSYSGTQPGPTVRITSAPEASMTNRHVILIEDIVDTGRTATAIIKHLQTQRPASIAVCALLDKPSRRAANSTPDYVGFTIENHFVVGFGLDYDGLYRQLPAIYVMT